jgi:hypothetical protein
MYNVLVETNYLAFLTQAALSFAVYPDLALAFKASNTNPDLLSFEQAMACEPAERQRSWVDHHSTTVITPSDPTCDKLDPSGPNPAITEIFTHTTLIKVEITPARAV